MKQLSPNTRREFLKSTTLATASALLAPALSAAEKSTRWPVACRDGHLKATGQPDCWAALKFINASAVEVLVNPDMSCPGLSHPTRRYTLATSEGAQALQADLQSNGVTISALCMANRLDEQLERELEWMRQVSAAASKFKVHAIRIDVVPRAIKRDEFLPFAIRACKSLCEVVQGRQNLAIENHGNTTNDPDFLQKLFDGVNSPYLGLTLDPANLYWFGHPLNDVYRICEKFADHAFHTHCKNIQYPKDKRNERRTIGWQYDKYTAPLYEGDIDYRRIAKILVKSHYTGDLCLENECLGRFPKDQGPEILKKEIAALKQVAS
jgi:sugar phosphate isomerase/epimerase